MIDQGKHSVLGVNIHAVDYEAAVEKITQAAKKGEAMSISALAVHGVMTGFEDEEHKYRLNQLSLVVPDGQPVKWALNLLHGTKLKDRVYGPNLTLKVAERAAKEGLPVYLYGSQESVLDKFEENLKKKFGLQVAGRQPSQFKKLTEEENDIEMQKIRESGAKIVFVGLGCPRQEVWVYENCNKINMPALAVGAAFDFHAGTLPQAPAWMQRNGLEWLFRLIQEPKRLWKRYLILNPKYLFNLLLQWVKLKKNDPSNAVVPSSALRYG